MKWVLVVTLLSSRLRSTSSHRLMVPRSHSPRELKKVNTRKVQLKELNTSLTHIITIITKVVLKVSTSITDIIIMDIIIITMKSRPKKNNRDWNYQPELSVELRNLLKRELERFQMKRNLEDSLVTFRRENIITATTTITKITDSAIAIKNGRRTLLSKRKVPPPLPLLLKSLRLRNPPSPPQP